MMTHEIDAVRQEYDKLAANYDRRWQRYVGTTLRAIVDRVPFQGRERLLDIACGTGELEQLLLSRWPLLRIVGADVSQGMLRQAAIKDKAKRVTWVQTDVAHLPIADQSFDYVICANSFHYFQSPSQALREIHRVLRPHGVFVLDDWCDDYLTCKLCSLWLRLTAQALRKIYSTRSCESLLHQAGFDVIHGDCFRVGLIWGMMHFICRRRESNPS
jgi:ubiquinone/menaquinone biosynthesis C-methylase UbiE